MIPSESDMSACSLLAMHVTLAVHVAIEACLQPLSHACKASSHAQNLSVMHAVVVAHKVLESRMKSLCYAWSP